MKRTGLFALFLAALYAAVGTAQQYPVLDAVANKVIAKYQNSSCEQLWQKKANKTPPTPEQQNLIQMLKNDSQMRETFINKIAAPVANKMFECGMIP